MVDPDLVRELAELERRLSGLEESVQSVVGEPVKGSPVPLLVAGSENEASGADQISSGALIEGSDTWVSATLDSLLSSKDRAAFDAWTAHRRVPWTRGDLIAVGLAGVVGALAVVYDDLVDAQMKQGLDYVRHTDLVESWEADAHGMPIDYTGPKFGGPAHRVRSPGHDLGRPFAALDQIRSGHFSGTFWEAGERFTFVSPTGAYEPVESGVEALILWGKHLVADVVTPMSLPLPGWTMLYEMPWRDVRKFAHDAYSGPALGEGLNVRSGLLSPLLSVLTTELIIRLHLHWRAYTTTGTAHLSVGEAQKRSEMLLVGHALVGATSLAAVAAAATAEGPVALRHVNVPVLLRTGMLAVTVVGDARTRKRLAPPTWDELLAQQVVPWELDAARVLAQAATSGGQGWSES